MADCKTRSKVTSPRKKSEGNSTRAKRKKAVPKREICPMNARAIRVLESVLRKRLARPHASATVIDRPVCNVKCSVVIHCTMCD